MGDVSGWSPSRATGERAVDLDGGHRIGASRSGELLSASLVLVATRGSFIKLIINLSSSFADLSFAVVCSNWWSPLSPPDLRCSTHRSGLVDDAQSTTIKSQRWSPLKQYRRLVHPPLHQQPWTLLSTTHNRRLTLHLNHLGSHTRHRTSHHHLLFRTRTCSRHQRRPSSWGFSIASTSTLKRNTFNRNNHISHINSCSNTIRFHLLLILRCPHRTSTCPCPCLWTHHQYPPPTHLTTCHHLPLTW
jgi:hypothetical protein